MRKIALETRWALDMAGYRNVKLFVSGGIDEVDIMNLRDVVDGFGIGTCIAFPPSVDIALDIVATGDRPISKKGKLPGKKQVYRCNEFHDIVTSYDRVIDRCPLCGGSVEPLLKPLMLQGRLVREIPSAKELRNRVLEQLKKISTIKDFRSEPYFLC